MVHVWDNVIEAKGVAKAYGDKLLYDNLNFTLQAGIVGIMVLTVLVNRLFSE
jgi:ABC-type transporter Mla maintaining outer membrane lipid asymmetry ATPase subunit MlaF